MIFMTECLATAGVVPAPLAGHTMNALQVSRGGAAPSCHLGPVLPRIQRGFGHNDSMTSLCILKYIYTCHGHC